MDHLIRARLYARESDRIMTRQEITIPFTIKRHHLVAATTLAMDKNWAMSKQDILNRTKDELRAKGESLATYRRSRAADELVSKLFPEWSEE
jgi:hypothetical protein